MESLMYVPSEFWLGMALFPTVLAGIVVLIMIIGDKE